MKQYNMKLTKDKESQWGFRLDMTVSELELVEKIIALVTDDTSRGGKYTNSSSCDSSYSWKEASNEIDQFLKSYEVGKEMPW